MVNIKLKWNKEVYESVSIEEDQGVQGFKEVVYQLTLVPKDRQKLMAKGGWAGILKDDADLRALNLKDGQQVMLMGTAEVVSAPKESVQFVEDMTVEEQALKGATVPAGLLNLGNTCYLNSTLQCLRYIPELREALRSSSSSHTSSRDNLAAILLETFDQMDRSGASIGPYQFVRQLRTSYPHPFSETNQHGFLQQDAEEFYNTVTREVEAEVGGSVAFNRLLGLELEEQLTCEETDLEQPVVRSEAVNKLVCNIQGGGGSQVQIDHMQDAVKLGLEGSVDKHSAVLGREATWRRRQRISSLPRYLCFQFMRFFWKPTPESRDHVGVKCKILRAVSFQDTIDVYDICSADLQAKLKLNRELSDKAFECELSAKRSKLSAEEPMSVGTAGSMQVDEPVAVAEEDPTDEDSIALAQALKLSVAGKSADIPSTAAPIHAQPPQPVAVGHHLPAGFTGLYELHGLVTHKGRSADSGHYIGWVRQGPGSSLWWCFNDNKVTEARTEDVLALKGGGDRDMAYLAFYRCKE